MPRLRIVIYYYSRYSAALLVFYVGGMQFERVYTRRGTAREAAKRLSEKFGGIPIKDMTQQGGGR